MDLESATSFSAEICCSHVCVVPTIGSTFCVTVADQGSIYLATAAILAPMSGSQPHPGDLNREFLRKLGLKARSKRSRLPEKTVYCFAMVALK
ncbi:hypothetical protein CEXT_4101 [Caerostris extrusa]|uniref:Uncharacterized protein n=1 Tax=Caerostris extrusa TaxID=172846 RepID=A0AAV4PKG2_CAEEX|nr:hypothetical protein CEXT_4101 [Caerostris extrusa]